MMKHFPFYLTFCFIIFVSCSKNNDVYASSGLGLNMAIMLAECGTTVFRLSRSGATKDDPAKKYSDKLILLLKKSFMKKVFNIYFLLCFFSSFVHSQDGLHLEGGLFLKRVENNMFQGQYNLRGKGDMEKLFFGDFNAMVEFIFLPSSENVSAFRILKSASSSSYVLELKYVSNYKEAHKEASKKHPSISLSPAELPSVSDVRRKQIMEHNRTAFAKQEEEKFKLFKIETRTFPISNQFAEKLRRNILSCITNYEAEAISNSNIVTVTRGGYSVTFRTLVDNAVLWSLCIQNPKSNTLKMADFCRQIIMDAQIDKLDERTYMAVLNTLEN